jgi:hypothetical protein
VDISHNPIASVERRDFFEKLTEDQLKKLIFLPKQWVKTGAWRALLTKFQDIVLETHKKYYGIKLN